MTTKISFRDELNIVRTFGNSERSQQFKVKTSTFLATEFSWKELPLAAAQSEVPVTAGIIVMYSEDDFVVKVGGTGETAITTKWFALDGANVTLYLTNPSGTDAITIEYMIMVR
jgi:hypothetical protein